MVALDRGARCRGIEGEGGAGRNSRARGGARSCRARGGGSDGGGGPARDPRSRGDEGNNTARGGALAYRARGGGSGGDGGPARDPRSRGDEGRGVGRPRRAGGALDALDPGARVRGTESRGKGTEGGERRRLPWEEKRPKQMIPCRRE